MMASMVSFGGIIGQVGKAGRAVDLINKGVQQSVKTGKIIGNAEKITKSIVSGGKGVQGLELGKAATASLKEINKGSLFTKIASNVLSVQSEARFEGIHASQEYSEEMNRYIESDEYQQQMRSEETNKFLKESPDSFYKDANGNIIIRPERAVDLDMKIAQRMNKERDAINGAAARAAATTFGLNFPILYASNVLQFGKQFMGGMNSQKSL
jgi:hypothetical protein